MKIDFHCHTKAVKSGEKATRNISAKDFKETVKSAGVKMIAITNHNTFDRVQFDQFKDEIKDDFILLPGIELDVIGLNKKVGHVVLVYDNTDLDNFDSKIHTVLGSSKPNNFTISLDDIISFINDINCIVLAHYYKPDALDINSINYLKEKINDNYRFFYEPSNYRTLGILINHNFRALKGTDITDWSEYGKQDFANIKLEIDSYKQLLKFLKKDETVIESLLNKQTKYSVNIAFKKDDKEIIDLYDNVNVLFGTKGTGKTVSLEKVEQYFKSNSKKISFYTPNDNKDKLDKKLNVSDEEKKLVNYGKENYAEEFSFINDWEEADVTQFIDYINYVKYKDKNENKKRMKIIEVSSVLTHNAAALANAKKDFNSIDNIISTLKQIDVTKYIGKNKNDELNTLLSELLVTIKHAYFNTFDDKLSVFLTNDAISKIKTIIEKKTETKTIPNETGFTNFAKNHFLLEINIKKILSGFEFKKESEPDFIGTLEEGKNLYRKTIITMLNDASKADDGFVGITRLREIKNSLNLINDNIYTKNLMECINYYKDRYDKSLSLDSFMGVIKKFTLDGLDYKPSSGEATMIILDEALKEDYDVYILDEPEKSLGNNYVSDILVKRLNDLAKMKKVVVVATHNANIAVRTMPYRSILKVYDNGEYKTYIGNPYVNKLVNIKNMADIKDWKAESIRILEGGKEAFDERSDIYAE